MFGLRLIQRKGVFPNSISSFRPEEYYELAEAHGIRDVLEMKANDQDFYRFWTSSPDGNLALVLSWLRRKIQQ